MLTRENAAGGTSLYLGTEDSLDEVPTSHRDIVTAEIRRAFADPVGHFREIAARCQIPTMAQWLNALIASGKWQLILDEGWMMQHSTQASFYFGSNHVQSAFVSPALDATSEHSLPAFVYYYSLVNVVHWDSFGCAGGLAGYGSHIPLAAMDMPCRNRRFHKDETFIFGSTADGDMLIYNRSGETGFLSHENGQAYSLGSVEQALEYIFGELLQRRTPEFEYTRKTKLG